jgi:hypothetical protein
MDPLGQRFLHDDPMDEARLDALVRLVEPIPPAPAARAGTLAGARLDDRFEPYVPALARILDVDEPRARALLAGLDADLAWEPQPGLPHVSSIWVDGGPGVARCIRGFVRMAAGTAFPHHRHLGDEHCLVLQGYMQLADGTVLGPGDELGVDADTEHSFTAREGGTDLLFFVIARTGIAIGDAHITHRD